MKKSAYILRILALGIAVMLAFSGCSLFASAASKAEKRLLEKGEFVADERHDNYKGNTLSVKDDKTYALDLYSYETGKTEHYEGTWSFVMTYKFSYTVTHDALELIKTTERVSWDIFKLDGCTDRGEQAYFIHKEYGGIIYHTSEEMTESHLEEHKKENGFVDISGCPMKTAANRDDSD